jgi:hypothetical protein
LVRQTTTAEAAVALIRLNLEKRSDLYFD